MPEEAKKSTEELTPSCNDEVTPSTAASIKCLKIQERWVQNVVLKYISSDLV